MSMIFYTDRQGRRLHPGEWGKLRMTPSYSIVRQYRRGDYAAWAFWTGEGLKPFKFTVQNGSFLDITSQDAATEKEAIDLYEHTLVTSGRAEWLNGKHFITHGNEHDEKDTAPEIVTAMAENENFATW